MDLMSFRELYGYLTTDKKAEIDAIKREAGTQEVDRNRAEEELFGSAGRHIVAQATPGLIDGGERGTPQCSARGAGSWVLIHGRSAGEWCSTPR